jgi:hypothetical protein
MKQNRYIIMLTKYILKTVKKKKGEKCKKKSRNLSEICPKYVFNFREFVRIRSDFVHLVKNSTFEKNSEFLNFIV